MIEAWDMAIILLHGLLEDAEDDLEAGLLMSKARVRQIRRAYQGIRDQRAAVLRGGHDYVQGEE